MIRGVNCTPWLGYCYTPRERPIQLGTVTRRLMQKNAVIALMQLDRI